MPKISFVMTNLIRWHMMIISFGTLCRYIWTPPRKEGPNPHRVNKRCYCPGRRQNIDSIDAHWDLVATNAVCICYCFLRRSVLPRTFYGNMLTKLSEKGKVAIITYHRPIVLITKNQELYPKAVAYLAWCREQLTKLIGLHMFGIGHYLGAKIKLLIYVDSETRYSLNILVNIIL